MLVKNDVSEMVRIVEECSHFGSINDLSEKDVYDITLILEEVVTNVIFYGYDDKNEHEIKIDVKLNQGDLVLEIEDDGKPFNPLDMPNPDVNLPIEERQIGGLGIYIVKNLVKTMDYRWENGKNFLKITKDLSK